MQLSVIILNYNVRHFLELCIRSVVAATKNISSEIIVVDNHSPDDSCSMVKSLFPDVILIENKENVGFSKANNQASKIAKGTYVCILNPDTVVAEDTFEKIIAFAQKKTSFGAIGCRLIDGSGAFLPESKRNIPTPKISLLKVLGFSTSYYASINEFETGKVAVLVGAFMFMKLEVYQQVKGFDEDYFMYGEDIDLSYKLLKSGYDNYYFPETTVIHFKGESTLKDARYAERFYGAMNIFYQKHFKSSFLLNNLVKLGIHLIPWVQKLKSNPEVTESKKEKILDNQVLSFKEIIAEIDKQQHNYRIRPKQSNFVLGSDTASSRGVVTELGDNLIEES